MTEPTLPPAARRPVTAIWFAAFALLFTALFFLRLSMASHAVILYIILPSLAAGIAGYIWGWTILDSSRVKTYRQSVLRGLVVSAGAYANLPCSMLASFPCWKGNGLWEAWLVCSSSLLCSEFSWADRWLL